MNNFTKNEEGATLVFVGVCLAVLLGFAALTFDLGRVAATQSDMQAYADHVALAAAGELDGKADSIIRATAAAEDLINDRQTFGTGTRELGEASDYTLRFLSGLPADDTDDDLSSFFTTDPLEATLVQVVTRDAPVFLPFYRAFGVLSGNTVNDGITRARAIAGFTQYACDIATLMFCKPNNMSAMTPGNSIRLRTGGQNAAWGPGNFGFLDPSDDAIDPNGPCAPLTGVARYSCLIASSGNRTRCFAQGGVNMSPGQKVGIENAVFNTRFDMYNGTMSQNRNSKIFAPAPHSIRGLKAATGNGNDNGNGTGGDNGNAGVCLGNNTEPSDDTMAFPPDNCIVDGNCTGDARFGNGDWDKAGYIAKNYDTAPAFASDTSVKTRFDVYKAEIAAATETVTNSGTGTSTNVIGDILTDRSETGRPMCSQAPENDNINRRVFIAAMMDCDENDINGAAEGVSVEAYFEVFLIRPVGPETGGSGGFDLDVEVIADAGGDGSGDQDDGGIFRNVVELYR